VRLPEVLRVTTASPCQISGNPPLDISIHHPSLFERADLPFFGPLRFFASPHWASATAVGCRCFCFIVPSSSPFPCVALRARCPTFAPARRHASIWARLPFFLFAPSSVWVHAARHGPLCSCFVVFSRPRACADGAGEFTFTHFLLLGEVFRCHNAPDRCDLFFALEFAPLALLDALSKSPLTPSFASYGVPGASPFRPITLLHLCFFLYVLLLFIATPPLPVFAWRRYHFFSQFQRQ